MAPERSTGVESSVLQAVRFTAILEFIGTLRVRPFPIATILFLLSGALGLGYELVWIRKAALVVGASQIALSTVLTSFFLGIALGSYAVGRWLRSQRWSPLFVYGLFELAIGVFAVAFPWLFDLLESLYGAIYPVVEGSAGALFAVRFLLLFLLVLVPTFFMGGTLPLLLDGLVAEDRSIGSRTSFLYGINILGAVGGVLVTCYWAIPALGMDGTSQVGGIGNFLVGAFALVAFRKHRPLHAIDGEDAAEEAGAEPAKEDAASDAVSPFGERTVFFPAAAFASGLLAIAYQVCWARYFTLFHTTTVYITALLLAVYLLALAVGSFLLAPLLARRWNPLRILAFVQALVPPAALFMIGWWQKADYSVALKGLRYEVGGTVYSPIKPTLEIDADYADYFLFWSEKLDAVFFAPFFQIALAIFVPVVLIGVGLPSLIAGAARHSAGLRAISGRLVFWNTLGSSAGGFMAGYAFLPVLGLHWTLISLGIGSLLLSVAALLASSRTDPGQSVQLSRQERRHGQEAAAAAGDWSRPFYWGFLGASLIGVVAFVVVRPDTSRDTIRRFGYGRNTGIERMPLVEVLEGPLVTAWVFDDENSLQVGSGHVSLAVTYKKDASTQAIQGHIPVLFYPQKESPRDCLGICLGSGQSFGALLMYDEVETLDVVDISTEMTDLSLRYFGEAPPDGGEPYNHDLGIDPRVTFHIDDGRHFVDRAPDASYDIVSMEPPPPTADGVCSLYSLEFYEGVRRILRDGGVFMQWLPLYRITPLDTRGIIKTQAAVFPETFVVKVGGDDFMVVSYPRAPRFDLLALRERCKVFATERMLKGRKWAGACQHEIASPEGVLSLLLMGPEDVAKMEPPMHANGEPMFYRDDTQILSYSSGDRWLLRLYRGPVLSSIAFTGLALSSFHTLSKYTDPPLDATAARALSKERAESLAGFNTYRSPPLVHALEQRLDAERRAGLEFIDGLDVDALAGVELRYDALTQPFDKAALAMSIARAYDAILAKEKAYEWIGRSLEAYPENKLPQHVLVAATIVENRIAVWSDVAESSIDRLWSEHRGSDIVRAMMKVLEDYREREADKNAKYLFPSR